MASVLELTLTIYDGLQHPDAVRWAQDGRVALLTQSLVIVLQYPGEESEPFVRFEVPIRKQQKVVDAGTLLAEDMYKDSAAMSYAVSRTSDGGVVTLIHTAVDWSPLGCSWDGGCLLATLSSDSVLEVFAPPLSPRALQLENVCCLSDLWTAFVQLKGYSVSQDSTAMLDSRRRRKGRKRGRGDVQTETISEDGNDMDSDDHEGGESGEGAERAHVGGYVGLEEWVRRVDLLTIDAMAWAKQRWREEVDGRGREHTLLAMGGRGRVLAFFAFSSKPLSQSGGSCYAVVPTPAALITYLDYDIFKLEWLAPEGSAITADSTTNTRSDHATLAVGSTYGSVELVRVVWSGGGAWDASRLRTICAPDLQPVICMRFVWDLPDGGPPGALAVAKGASLMVWALPSGEVTARELEAHTHNIGGMDTCYGPDGQGPHVLTGSMDGTVKVWQYVLAEGGRCSFELSPELSSMIPTNEDPLMGLAVSPNRLALALARVIPGSDTNERKQQLNRHLRKNHCCIALQPVFQDGWRNVVLPEDSDALLRLMGWKAMYGFSWAAVPAPPPVVDLIMVASLDFASMMEVQAHPDFLEEAGTALGPDLVAVEKVEAGGEEKDQQGAEEEATANGGEEATANGGDPGAADEQKGRNGRRANKAPGVTRRLKNMLVRVDLGGLPTSSLEILADTVFDRLRGLLWGCPVAHIDEKDDAPPVRLLPIWQALHALCSHISDKHLSKQRPEHLMLTNTQILIMATTFITATYVDRSLGALLERVGTAEGAAAALPSEERQIALNMASWVELNKTSVEEQCAREGGTWEELVQMTLSVVGDPSELVERCVLCSAAVPFNDSRIAECERGHTLSRCMETLLVLESFEYWECPVCHSMTRSHVSSLTGDGRQDTVKATESACSPSCGMASTLLRPPWLQPPRKEGVWCIFCNMSCTLVNA